MTEIREELNRRLSVLRDRSESDFRILADHRPDELPYQRAARNVQELRGVEATLATMQLADAQKDVAKAQREVADAQTRDTEARAERQSTTEDITFWARRFVTTLTVANAAGFLSVLLFLTKPDSPEVALPTVSLVLKVFAAGTVVGGLYPAIKILMSQLRFSGRFRLIIEAVYPFVMAVCLMFASATASQTALDAYEARFAVTSAPRPAEASK